MPVIVLGWWGEAPEWPDDSSEATDDERFTNLLGLRTRRAGPSARPRLGALFVLVSTQLVE
jgi:hypothetical protein